jgi:acetyl/propionyl-CoA carboxylase alpha subunit
VLDDKRQPGKFHDATNEWLQSFAVDDVKCLVVCRGPVRKEALDIFESMGIKAAGILLSEKDSIVYPRSLAPELRSIEDVHTVHRIQDYMGSGQEEKVERIEEIIQIAISNSYTHVFAGYGFMAEDADFIETVENAGLSFIGPSSSVCRIAGAKDEAKKLARGLGNAVIPGVDDISARALLKKAADRKALEALAKANSLEYKYNDAVELAENAEQLLLAGYRATIELVTIEDLQEAAGVAAGEMWDDYPSHRIRFKHIAGGGGKGQRVVEKPEDVASAVMDVLAEVKMTAPGANRNFLVELNIETSRHNEIQLIGNGDWSLSLGGRDCSVQMHEQKLLEVSLTKELLEDALVGLQGVAAETVKGDIETLARMEAESERFGVATGLNSVSTFECIVDGTNHFFMEMNTRIQVEHGVTELAYALKFTNPDNSAQCFYVEELIEAMVLLAVHGSRLPKPERVPRFRSGIEVRINATNDALQPHAGGIIKGWSSPIEGEIRFDQGIGTRNPDTGAFVFYNLAGAYDSNIALVLSSGENRDDNLQSMAEILRRTELRGEDLKTNMDLHYGLCNWFVGKAPMGKPDTGFMLSYLAAVGSLQKVVNDVDLNFAATEILKDLDDPSAQKAFRTKQTLLLRPLEKLLESPHVLAGFIGRYDGVLWENTQEGLKFRENPIRFLREIYHYLNIENARDKAPCDVIWDHDEVIMERAITFYDRVRELAGTTDWKKVQAVLEGDMHDKVASGDAKLWAACQAAHRGFQVGLEILLIIPSIGIESGFSGIEIGEDFTVKFPEKFLDAEAAGRLARVLAPAPKASPDEIAAPTGGSFYAREAPHLDLLVEEGEHFEAGQPLFIIEVMKMFNKVLAPCSGTVTENRMKDSDGTIVVKGQTIFKIEPDERIVEESAADIAARKKSTTKKLLG